MKTKSKIIIFICTFCLLFSLLAVSCFASVQELLPGYRYIPSSDSSLYPSEDYDVSASFSVAGEISSGVYITSEGLVFSDRNNESFVAFVPSLGFLDANTLVPIDVEFITFNSFSGSTEEYDLLCSVLDPFVESDPDSFYNQIFNSISGAVFGEDSLTPEQNLSLSLISTVVSIGLVLLPVLLAIGFLLRCFRL